MIPFKVVVLKEVEPKEKVIASKEEAPTPPLPPPLASLGQGNHFSWKLSRNYLSGHVRKGMFKAWIPAFAGMTILLLSFMLQYPDSHVPG